MEEKNFVSLFDEIYQKNKEVFDNIYLNISNIFIHPKNYYTYQKLSQDLNKLIKKGDKAEIDDKYKIYTISQIEINQDKKLSNISILLHKTDQKEEETQKIFEISEIIVEVKLKNNLNQTNSKILLDNGFLQKNDFTFVSKDNQLTIVFLNDVTNISANKNQEMNGEMSEIEKLKKELEAEKEKRLVLMSDFQNYKKRIEAERASFGAIANISIIEMVMEVFDDIGLALSDSNLSIEQAKISLESAKNKIKNLVESSGFEVLNIKIGDVFDHSKMEAISTIEAGEENKNKVIAIVNSGMKLKDKDNIIKPAKVVVGK